MVSDIHKFPPNMRYLRNVTVISSIHAIAHTEKDAAGASSLFPWGGMMAWGQAAFAIVGPERHAYFARKALSLSASRSSSVSSKSFRDSGI